MAGDSGNDEGASVDAMNHGGAEVKDGGATDGSDTGAGCGANSLLPLPEDPTLRGPWDVGVRTVQIGRLTVEVLYPAEPGSTAGVEEVSYDLRDWLPQRERQKVPDSASPAVSPIGGHLYRDVPVDATHGPYPAVIMIHGTASFRIASGTTNVHWASRGMIVLAADYPGLGLADQLSATLECGLPQSGAQDIPGDVRTQITALGSASGELAFLDSHVDVSRLGLAGHSQGACTAAVLANLPNVKVVLALTGSTVASASTSVESLMWIAGLNDTVIGYRSALIGNTVCPANPLPAVSNFDAYSASPAGPGVVKRIVGISGGGHLVPSDLCQDNALGRNAIEQARIDGVCGITTAVAIGLPALFDCGTISMEKGLEAVNYASTAALEEALHCLDRSAQFDSLRQNLAQVGDFQQTP